MLKSVLKQWWSATRPVPAPPGIDPQALESLRQGRLDEAERAFRAACALRPENAESWHLYGHALSLGRKHEAAVAALETAVRLAPGNAEALYNLGAAYGALRDRTRAAECFERAVAVRPDWHVPWLSLGDLHAGHDAVDQAEDAYRRALALAPDAAETHYNFANLLVRCGLADDAIAHYREALRLQPSFIRAYSNFLCALNYSGSFAPEAVRDAYLEFDRRFTRALAPATLPHRDRVAGEALRIGYVSPDFRIHAVSTLCEPALKHHDSARYRIYCYSNVDSADARTERLRGYVAVWRDIAGESDEAVAELVRNDGIDILVDLAGHTDRNRLLVFARKPAPVQVNWIASPNTTGLSAMDYRITDALTDPPGTTEHLHSERLLRLAPIYAPFEAPDDDIPVNPLPLVSRGHVTFGAFNTLMKVTPTAIELWARVLRGLPDSHLVILPVPAGRPRARLASAFEKHGVVAERLEFRGRLSSADFLRAHGDVDIGLDTFPYHGSVTTAHAIWMGVPVVSLAGATHASRVGLSILSNLGLADLVARTPDEYVARAVALARDVQSLQTLRSSLRARLESSPVMDGPHFTRGLEAAYEKIWEEYCRTRA